MRRNDSSSICSFAGGFGPSSPRLEQLDRTERGENGSAERGAKGFTAVAGSPAGVTARTTTIRLAPAARTSARFEASIPPIANQGFVSLAAASGSRSMPAAGRPGFVGVSCTGPTAM